MSPPVKLLPCAGRGMKVPPICDVLLPTAYYNEKPSHTHMLSQSGLGRGRKLQELLGPNGDVERIGERLFTANIMPQPPACSDASRDDFPVLKSDERDDAICQDRQTKHANFRMPKSVNGHDASCDDLLTSPSAEVSQMSLKSLAAQFTERS